jgi:hypothetical protein
MKRPGGWRFWVLASFAGALPVKPAAAADAPLCAAAEPPPTPGVCRGVATYKDDPMASLSNNDTFHFIAYLAGIDNVALPLSGPIRFALGPGLLVGVAPTPTQLVRLAVGGTLLFGEWGADRLGGVSIEPRLRASVNLAPSSIVPIDLYVEGVVPYFVSGERATVGVGAGVSTRLASVAVEAGADFLFGKRDFGEAASPSPDALRAFISVGFDLFAAAAVTQRTGPHQTRVDLRCSMLAYAHSLATPGSCGDVQKALDDAYAEPDMPAMDRFFGALPKPLQTQLQNRDRRYAQCLEAQRSIQRWCVDCTGETLSYWFSYTLDPHQIAAALGCVDGVRPADALCAEVDANAAAEHETQCIDPLPKSGLNDPHNTD